MTRLALAAMLVCLVGEAALGQDEEEASEEQLLEEEFALLEDSEKVYAASRHEQSILESPPTVTVIGRERIENTHCLDITCLLRGVPGLEIRQMSPLHHSVGARALASELNDKVLLLVDGQEANIEALGMPVWPNLGISLEDIERIEVVRGPASALYGANAHSLVVNITTRRPQRDAAEVFLGGAEQSHFSLGGFLQQDFDDFAMTLRAGRETAGPAWTGNSLGLETFWAGLVANYKWRWGTSSLDATYSKGDGQLMVSLAPAAVDNSHFVRASLSHQADWFSLRFWYQLMALEAFYDLPITYGNNKLGSLAYWLTWINHTADAEVQISRSFFDGNLLVAGANYRWLGIFLESNLPEWNYQHRLGVFLHDEQRLGDFLLVTGVRLDYNSVTPFTVSPRAALVWKYGENKSLRAGFGRAFRKPSFMNTSLHVKAVKPEPGFEALVNFMVNSIGNDKLKNENVNSFELGWRAEFLEGRLDLEADAFFNLYRNAIAFSFNVVEDSFGIIDLSRSTVRFENEGLDVDSLGGSLSAVWRPKEWLRLSANYTVRHSWYVSSPPPGYVFQKGDRVSWEPQHLFNFAADAKLPHGFRFELALFARSSIREPWSENGSMFGKGIWLSEPARAMLGGYLSWRMGSQDRWLETGVRVQNLFDEPWRDLTHLTRFDGKELGGMLCPRVVLAFLRASV